MPLISIIIPTHNGLKNLIECLNSIECSKYSPFEVIVVEAASSDGTYETIIRQFPKVTVLRIGDCGWGESLNHGILQAKGDYMVFLSDDYTVDPLWLNELIGAINETNKYAIVGGKICFYKNKQTVVSAGGKIGRTGTGSVCGFGKPAHNFNVSYETDFTPVPLVNKFIFGKIGLFDSEYFCSYDETDFCFRAKKKGFKILYVPTALLWHKIGGTTSPNSVKSFYYWHHNRLRFVMKNFSFSRAIFLLPLIYVLYLAQIPRLVINGKSGQLKALFRSMLLILLEYRDINYARTDPFRQSLQRLPRKKLHQFLNRLNCC